MIVGNSTNNYTLSSPR